MKIDVPVSVVAIKTLENKQHKIKNMKIFLSSSRLRPLWIVATLIFCAAVLIPSDSYSARRFLVGNAANNGSEECLGLWEPANHEIPEDIEWFRTLVVGFPSGDKRLAFMQLEGLTKWAARDEWAYEAFGMTNNPFIKSNYPHYDGAWGWESE